MPPVAPGFTAPLFLTAPANDPRLFVVEQGGAITVIGHDSGDPFGNGRRTSDLPGDIQRLDASGNGSITSFGEDAAGEPYVIGANGAVQRIVEAHPA